MRLALAVESFFTNGEAPPLGAAIVAGSLRGAGHDVEVFDFNWLDVMEAPDFFLHLKQYTGVWRNPERVNFLNNLDFVIYSLFPEEFSKASQTLEFVSEGGCERHFMALSMACEARAAVHAAHLLDSRPQGILLSTYISNLPMSLLLIKALRMASWSGPVWLGGPGVGHEETRRFITEIMGDNIIFPMASSCSEAPGLGMKSSFSPDFKGFPFSGTPFDDYRLARPPAIEGTFMGSARQYLPMVPMTGCPIRCSFCSETAIWSSLATREPSSVAEELFRLRDEWNCDTFMLNCSAVNSSRKWLDTFGRAMTTLAGNSPPPSWWSYFRPTPDLLDASFVSRLHSGGLRWATLGLESGSKRILDLMGKATDPSGFHGILDSMNGAGVEVTASLLTGFPGETWDDVAMTRDVFAGWYSSRGEGVDVSTGPSRTGTFFDIGGMVRLEPYSDMYRDPGRFGISIYPRNLILPKGLSRFSGIVSRIALSWGDSVSWEEKSARQRWLIDEGISFGEARKGRAW